MITTQFCKSVQRHDNNSSLEHITMRGRVRTSEITRLSTPLNTTNRFFLQLHDIYYSRKKRLASRSRKNRCTQRFPHQ